jgi:hypothetical protein
VYNIIGKQQKTPKREADHMTSIADEMYDDKSTHIRKDTNIFEEV